MWVRAHPRKRAVRFCSVSLSSPATVGRLHPPPYKTLPPVDTRTATPGLANKQQQHTSSHPSDRPPTHTPTHRHTLTTKPPPATGTTPSLRTRVAVKPNIQGPTASTLPDNHLHPQTSLPQSRFHRFPIPHMNQNSTGTSINQRVGTPRRLLASVRRRTRTLRYSHRTRPNKRDTEERRDSERGRKGRFYERE